MQPRLITLLELYEQAKHGVVVKHLRRSDEDRPLCRKAFRVGSAVHGWQRECVPCARAAEQFRVQQAQELAKVADRLPL